ncbi:MAG: 30S ribosomal protein S17, partial [Gordonia sp. (in: high G+C Gram-positive bacteria)]
MSEDQKVNTEDRASRKERIGYVVSDKMTKT